MKTYGLILLLVAFSWSGSSLAAKDEKAPEVLFAQSAKSFAFKDGTLTLRQASPNTIFFSNRPKRIAGHVRNDLFLKLWIEGKNSFQNDPPNAALSIFNPDGKVSQAVVVLSNPRADGSNLTYDVRVLEGTIPPAGAESTLFIDGSDAPCSDPGTLAADDSSYSGSPCWAGEVFSDAE